MRMGKKIAVDKKDKRKNWGNMARDGRNIY